MKTIKMKIFMPYITVIIIMALVIMLIFNITLRYFSQKIAIKELESTIAGVEHMVRNQLIGGVLDELRDNSGRATILDRLNILRSSIKIANLSENTELLLISSNGEVLFPQNFDDSFLTKDILQNSLTQINSSEPDEIIKIDIKEDKYIASYREIGTRLRTVKLVFISSANMAKEIIRTINIVLLVIILLASAIAAIISMAVSKSISKPIERLSNHAKKIDFKEFKPLEDDNSSEEIYNLTVSMNDMLERLKNYDNTQKSFLQNASHELRTPLMSIGGYAEGIAKGVFPDTASAAEIICEESRRLNALVDELLTLSRLESNGYKFSLMKHNLCDLMKDYVQKAGGFALKENKSITLSCNEEKIFVSTDEHLLAQSVLNIISNCIRYAEKNVDVHVERQVERVVVKISDDGNGIPENDLPHIFERFYKGKKGNFGLGLSIAKSALDIINGDVKAYNGEKGAVFEIILKTV